MAYLFLDTSRGFNFGLLSDEYDWIEFKKLEVKKTSQIIHKEIHSLLESHNLDIKSLSGVFILSGPGSYTGMRVAEGVAQIFELEGITIFSFTTFSLAELLDIENPIYIYEAFKGELFLWSKDGGERLVAKASFSQEGEGDSFVTHGARLVAEVECLDLLDFVQTQPVKIFKYVKSQKLRERPFYFRPLEVEFKKSTK